MEQVREIVSKGSSSEQLRHELTAMTKEERQSLLESVLHKDTAVSIPSEEILAMKADLCVKEVLITLKS